MIHLASRLLVAGFVCSSAGAPCLAQGQFTGNYAWRNQFRVGQPVEVNPGLSPPPVAWIQCVVSENSPESVMRVDCQPYDGKSYYAGSRIVGETDVVSLPAPLAVPAQAGDWVEVQSPFDQKWERMQVVALANGRAIVKYEWDANNQSTKVVLAQFVRGGTAPPPPPAMPRDLAGTYWSMMAMTKLGETVREVSAPPDVEFTRAGTWGILRYGGSRTAGRYRIEGNVVTMVYEKGEPYGSYRMVWLPALRRLELVSSDYTLRLKFVKPITY